MTRLSPAITAERIEVLFGVVLGPKKYCIDGGPELPIRGGGEWVNGAHTL